MFFLSLDIKDSLMQALASYVCYPQSLRAVERIPDDQWVLRAKYICTRNKTGENDCYSLVPCNCYVTFVLSNCRVIKKRLEENLFEQFTNKFECLGYLTNVLWVILCVCIANRRVAMMRNLLAPYEQRPWAQTNWILVRFWKVNFLFYLFKLYLVFL